MSRRTAPLQADSAAAGVHAQRAELRGGPRIDERHATDLRSDQARIGATEPSGVTDQAAQPEHFEWV